MSKAYDARLAAYAAFRDQHPAEPLRFFAAHFGVNVGTVSRWNRALKKLNIQEEAIDELETRLRKEYEAKLQALLDDKEQERAEAARKKAEAERLRSESRRQHFARILKECARETIVTSQNESITWQGVRYDIPGGVPTEVPEVIAGVWRDAQKARGEASRTIQRYSMGQHLGKV